MSTAGQDQTDQALPGARSSEGPSRGGGGHMGPVDTGLKARGMGPSQSQSKDEQVELGWVEVDARVEFDELCARVWPEEAERRWHAQQDADRRLARAWALGRFGR